VAHGSIAMGHVVIIPGAPAAQAIVGG